MPFTVSGDAFQAIKAELASRGYAPQEADVRKYPAGNIDHKEFLRAYMQSCSGFDSKKGDIWIRGNRQLIQDVGNIIFQLTSILPKASKQNKYRKTNRMYYTGLEARCLNNFFELGFDLQQINLGKRQRDKIIALLKEGTCPICGRKGFGNPLGHINRTHGISKNEVKDALMISHLCGFAGEKLSQASRESAKKNRAAGKWYAGQNKGNKGHTKATKEKQAFIQKEIFKKNPDLLLKFKEGNKNAHKRQEKPVLRISPNGDIKEYRGVNYAARVLGIDASSISKAARGKNGRSCVAGYRWKYKEGD